LRKPGASRDAGVAQAGLSLHKIRKLALRRARLILLLELAFLTLIILPVPFRTLKVSGGHVWIMVSSTISIDPGRIALLSSVNGTTKVVVYDTLTKSNASFSPPNSISISPQIAGNKVVIASASSLLTPAGIYYCTLTSTTCSSWVLIATGPNISAMAANGPPLFVGDLVVWANAGSSLAYYRFSSNLVTNVTAPAQPHYPTTNGAIITFSAKPFSNSTSQTIFYLDTTKGSSSSSTNTGFLGFSPEISQRIIAFTDNSTVPTRIRYYDIDRNLSSPAGGGPVGEISFGNNPAIWDNRIVFSVSETNIGFDCDGDGVISATQYCLDYWNINAPNWVSPTASPDAVPALGSNRIIAIHEDIVAFVVPMGTLEVLTVPMKGDVNQDGKVNIIDLVLSAACFGQLLKSANC